MAKTHPKLDATSIFFIILFVSSILLLPCVNSQQFSRKLTKKEMGLMRKEKLSHLHFYFHDIVSGKNPTAVRVAGARNTSSITGFGDVVMIDDPLTEGPDLSSKLVGRAQGIYAFSAMNEVGLLMVLNYVFVQGKYNGSTLSILGKNSVLSRVREMPIVGGSGLFRFARGYAEAKTHTFNAMTGPTGDAVVEYNVYVFHY